jgi:hypothetical protein
VVIAVRRAGVRLPPPVSESCHERDFPVDQVNMVAERKVGDDGVKKILDVLSVIG